MLFWLIIDATFSFTSLTNLLLFILLLHFYVLAPKYLKAIHSLLKLELAWVERMLSKYKFFKFALLILYLYVPACILLLMNEHEELNL